MCYAGKVPRFEPFTGLRYDASVPLEEVIAPPYDVVSPDEREKLAARHRANSILVELPADDPASALDRYQVAARLLSLWVEEGVLREERRESMYAYRMTEPARPSTLGVVGALGCEPEGGDVLAHEQTIPKDMTDRLQLLRACRANLSPIWGLSLTEGITEIVDPSGAPDRCTTDDDGVLHELWVIDDATTLDAVSRAVSSSPVVIADGHHRYGTALAYQAERRAEEPDAPARGGFDMVMALIVELTEDQLEVGAIHRVMRGLPDEAATLQLFGRWFDCESSGEPSEELVDSLVAERVLALLTRENVWRLTPNRLALGREGSELDSTLASIAIEEAPRVLVGFRHDPRAAWSDVSTGAADAALLLRPVTISQISRWAHDRKRMPPKSTYFHPKPRTGMVFRRLEDV
jgi:uncharacterized protein (DUF1015 family)